MCCHINPKNGHPVDSSILVLFTDDGWPHWTVWYTSRSFVKVFGYVCWGFNIWLELSRHSYGRRSTACLLYVLCVSIFVRKYTKRVGFCFREFFRRISNRTHDRMWHLGTNRPATDENRTMDCWNITANFYVSLKFYTIIAINIERKKKILNKLLACPYYFAIS